MFNCIIIDDEPLAIEVIERHITQSGLLELSQSFTNAAKALTYLQKKPVDLAFIDIQMPGLTGLDIIQSLERRTKFIITSAYREYALDGYDLDVLDFLMKPVSYERFLKSLSRFVNHSVLPLAANSQGPRFIFIREGRKMTKIFLESIIYLESQKDFIRIVTNTGNHLTRGTMSYYQQWLPVNEFIRVHRSYLVAISGIKTYTDDDIEMTGGQSIPVGELYRKSFREILQKHFL